MKGRTALKLEKVVGVTVYEHESEHGKCTTIRPGVHDHRGVEFQIEGWTPRCFYVPPKLIMKIHFENRPEPAIHFPGLRKFFFGSGWKMLDILDNFSPL